jgi:hypothetical protein
MIFRVLDRMRQTVAGASSLSYSARCIGREAGHVVIAIGVYECEGNSGVISMSIVVKGQSSPH